MVYSIFQLMYKSPFHHQFYSCHKTNFPALGQIGCFITSIANDIKKAIMLSFIFVFIFIFDSQFLLIKIYVEFNNI